MKSRKRTKSDDSESNSDNSGSDNAKKGKRVGVSERRRERSKVAARFRRSKETEIFTELSSCLPIQENVNLDKATVVRLSLSHLKMRNMMEKVFDCPEHKEEFDYLVSGALNGFLMVLSMDGDIVYISESISTHLGLSQLELLGQNIYDLTHPCDEGDLTDLLQKNKKVDRSEEKTRSEILRLKCSMTQRGRNVHLRAAAYKVINYTGRIFVEENGGSRWFVGIGEPLLHPSDVEIPLDKQTFLTKHTPDMKMEFVDESVRDFLGFRPDELIGKSMFEVYHAGDWEIISSAFKSLHAKGQSQTERYRFLCKGGGWLWVVTQATLIMGNHSTKPNSVVCLHFVTSGIENCGEILSGIQLGLPEPPLAPKEEPKKKVKRGGRKKKEKEEEKKENVTPSIPFNPQHHPIPSTLKIFTTKTQDMESTFMPPIDQIQSKGGKEELEDLTHLAPIAGDEFVSLNFPILDDNLKNLIDENYEIFCPSDYNDVIDFTFLKAEEQTKSNVQSIQLNPIDANNEVEILPSPPSYEIGDCELSPSNSLFDPFLNGNKVKLKKRHFDPQFNPEIEEKKKRIYPEFANQAPDYWNPPGQNLPINEFNDCKMEDESEKFIVENWKCQYMDSGQINYDVRKITNVENHEETGGKNGVERIDWKGCRKRGEGTGWLGCRSLCELSRADCEVNAPLQCSSSLLQGPELLTALELSTIPDSII